MDAYGKPKNKSDGGFLDTTTRSKRSSGHRKHPYRQNWIEADTDDEESDDDDDDGGEAELQQKQEQLRKLNYARRIHRTIDELLLNSSFSSSSPSSFPATTFGKIQT